MVEIYAPGESRVAVAARAARDEAVQASAATERTAIGATAYSATLAPLVLTEDRNGVMVTTTFAPGVITEVYGAPINETWVTTITAGSVVKERV
ncbi:hypothetical protein EOD42_16920 [Rhodovarius crocodyli]|uniref:Uncharacterized protein n=1 Tax=Rhodovarius crocodyli TaxID=1979269 RepID=A0A437MC93_9PROT|nr:hypothetical protein [Rhodovarius crocodyli]RVT95266.1 hypothetical protein EOD42_16920 [Rhodovarius crocodyli]